MHAICHVISFHLELLPAPDSLVLVLIAGTHLRKHDESPELSHVCSGVQCCHISGLPPKILTSTTSMNLAEVRSSVRRSLAVACLTFADLSDLSRV